MVRARAGLSEVPDNSGWLSELRGRRRPGAGCAAGLVLSPSHSRVSVHPRPLGQTRQRCSTWNGRTAAWVVSRPAAGRSGTTPRTAATHTMRAASGLPCRLPCAARRGAGNAEGISSSWLARKGALSRADPRPPKGGYGRDGGDAAGPTEWAAEARRHAGQTVPRGTSDSPCAGTGRLRPTDVLAEDLGCLAEYELGGQVAR